MSSELRPFFFKLKHQLLSLVYYPSKEATLESF